MKANVNQLMMQFLARNNFYVMIDDHSEDSTYVDSPSAWPGMWAALVKDIVADPRTANRVFVDLINEPDHANFNWQTVRFFVLLSVRWSQRMVLSVCLDPCTAMPY